MIKFSLPFCLLFFLCVSAQKEEKTERIYFRTLIETSAYSMPQALRTADSLYTTSATPLQKAKSLLLLASLHKQAGNLKKALFYAENAKSFSVKTDDTNMDFRITGFLATEYRIVGLHDKSEEYIRQALKISKKIREPDNLLQAKILLNQEQAYHEIYKENYRSAIRHIEASLADLKKINTKNIPYTDFISANSYQLLGISNYHLGNYDISENYYNKSKNLLKSPSYLLGFVQNGIAAVNIKKKKWDIAKVALDKADCIAEKLEDIELQKETYFNYSKFYEETGESKLSAEYYRKYIILDGEINSEIQELINDSYNKLNNSHDKSVERSSIKSIIIILLTFLFLGLFIAHYVKQKKQQKRFNAIINASKPQLITDNNTHISHEEISKTPSKNDSPMSSETESKLLGLLEEFENGNSFNEKSMSLSVLSAKLNTNARYLSYVINTHKGEDFKNYINRLRINYIVNKLTTDKKYRQYKISSLADECGFSSHSKFAAIFKTFTGLSPSLFVKYLEKE